MPLTLYHYSNSVCSEKVRIALHEKGVLTESTLIAEYIDDSFPGPALLPRAPQPLHQLSPPVPVRRNHHRCQGPPAQALPLQTDDDPLRQIQITARCREIPQTRDHLLADRFPEAG